MKNITKEVRNLYIDSYDINGKNEEDTNKWTDISYLWVQRNNIVKMKITDKEEIRDLQQHYFTIAKR